MPVQRSLHQVPTAVALGISLLALLVAVSSTAVAAGLAANSVGSKQLKANAVKTADLGPQAVGSAKIQNGAVTGAKVADGAVTGAKVANGSLTAGDLANGTLLAKPLSFDYLVDTGNTKELGTYGGLRISLRCELVSSDIRSRVLIVAATPAATVDSMGENTVVTTATSAFAGVESTTEQPSAVVELQADPATGGTNVFNGMYRAEDGPWVHAVVGAIRNASDTTCRMRGLFTVTD